MSVFDEVISAVISRLPAASHAVSKRADGWANVLTGMGMSTVDKTANTQPVAFTGISDQYLAHLYHGDHIVRKAVGMRVDEALRLGVQVSVGKEAGGIEAATAVIDALDDLKAIERIREAATWENLFGGAVIVIGVDDGQDGPESQALPIKVANIRKVAWLRTVDKRRVFKSPDPADIDMNPMSPTYGEPTHYLIDTINTGAQVRVHASRVVVFPGLMTTPEVRQQRHGWGISVVDVIWDALQRNITAWQSAGNAVANAQYVVYKLKGLANILMGDGAEAKVQRRSRAMELAKSMINAVLIDADDEYLRENPNFGNMGEMLDRFMLEVSAALEIPATKLWGRSPAGMNATGESDTDGWYASCDAYREHHLRQRVAQIVGLVLASRDGPTKGKVPDQWAIKWPSLRQLSPLQEADLKLKTAQADKTWIDAQVLLADEVATNRFRPEGFSTETQVDHEAREAILAAELERLKNQGRDPVDVGEDEPEAAE